jgi:hypothetical protein
MLLREQPRHNILDPDGCELLPNGSQNAALP